MKLHQRLQIVADGRGITREAISARTGFIPREVAVLLDGGRPISPPVLTRLLDALGVNLPGTRRDFHMQGAREAGWEISPPY